MAIECRAADFFVPWNKIKESPAGQKSRKSTLRVEIQQISFKFPT